MPADQVQAARQPSLLILLGAFLSSQRQIRAVKCACLLQAKRKLVDVSQQRDQLQGSIEELQQKYNQKCQ